MRNAGARISVPMRCDTLLPTRQPHGGVGMFTRCWLFGFGFMTVLTLTAVPVQSEATDSFRWLAIEGRQVRWFPAEGRDTVLKYAIASFEHRMANAVNCGVVLPPQTLLQTSSITAADFSGAVRSAFASWERHIAISFVEVGDQTAADIVIGEQALPIGFAFANVTISKASPGPVGSIERASVCLNPHRKWKLGYDGNLETYDLKHTLTHEIGHAIGLDHPNVQGHVMSYKYHESREGLSDGDVLGAVKLYGRRPLGSKHAMEGQIGFALQPIYSPAAQTVSQQQFTSRSAVRP